MLLTFVQATISLWKQPSLIPLATSLGLGARFLSWHHANTSSKKRLLGWEQAADKLAGRQDWTLGHTIRPERWHLQGTMVCRTQPRFLAVCSHDDLLKLMKWSSSEVGWGLCTVMVLMTQQWASLTEKSIGAAGGPSSQGVFCSSSRQDSQQELVCSPLIQYDFPSCQGQSLYSQDCLPRYKPLRWGEDKTDWSRKHSSVGLCCCTRSWVVVHLVHSFESKSRA